MFFFSIHPKVDDKEGGVHVLRRRDEKKIKSARRRDEKGIVRASFELTRRVLIQSSRSGG